MTQAKTPNKLEAIAELWHRGILHWKLDSGQKHLYDTYKNSTYKKVVFNCSRRLGKSHTLLIIAFEKALQEPGSQIKYGSGEATAIKKAIEPNIREILKDCPKALLPKFNRQDSSYTFTNGSKLFLDGLDAGRAERLRGAAAHLVVVDEAGFVNDDLHYIINSILLPQTLTTRGKIIIASTPPKTPGHPFVDYIKEAEFHNSYCKMTLLEYMERIKNDSQFFRDRIPQEEIDNIRNSTDEISWKREYLCELITDDQSAIFPEFTEAIEKECVLHADKPPYYHPYTSLDFGFRDFHAALFAYYDFKNNRVVIEDELLIPGQNTNTAILASLIKEKEMKHWYNKIDAIQVEPNLRIADDNMIVIQDLQTLHGLPFVPTKKDNKEAAINETRIKIASKQIIINPRCTNLIFQLKSGIWDKNKKTYARSPDHGHYDLLDALVYLIRNIQWSVNPYPKSYKYDHSTHFKAYEEEEISDSGKIFKDLFFNNRFTRKNNKY